MTENVLIKTDYTPTLVGAVKKRGRPPKEYPNVPITHSVSVRMELESYEWLKAQPEATTRHGVSGAVARSVKNERVRQMIHDAVQTSAQRTYGKGIEEVRDEYKPDPMWYRYAKTSDTVNGLETHIGRISANLFFEYLSNEDDETTQREWLNTLLSQIVVCVEIDGNIP